MQLEKCNIRLVQWGDNTGQYEVEIAYIHDKSRVELNLPPELGNALLAVVSQHILKASQETASRLHNSIASTILAPPIETRQIA